MYMWDIAHFIYPLLPGLTLLLHLYICVTHGNYSRCYAHLKYKHMRISK